MITLLNRIKSTLQSSATVTANVSTTSIQIVSPDTLPDIAITALPYIGIAPVSTAEKWFSTGMMEFTHTVRIYIVQNLEIIETSLIGGISDKKSVLEITDTVKTALRANFFASGGVNYLSKPSELTTTRYNVVGYGDNIYAFVSVFDITAPEIVAVTTT